MDRKIPLMFDILSLIVFTFAFAFARCERALKALTDMKGRIQSDVVAVHLASFTLMTDYSKNWASAGLKKITENYDSWRWTLLRR